MSSTWRGPADATPSASAIPNAAGIIIGAIARANCTHIGLSSATVLLLTGAIVPRRIVSVSVSKFPIISGDARPTQNAKPTRLTRSNTAAA